MSPVEQNSGRSDYTNERKRWETPVVIVGSARHETLSTINTGGVDGTTSGYPVGS
jgi:hypothetical protein